MASCCARTISRTNASSVHCVILRNTSRPREASEAPMAAASPDRSIDTDLRGPRPLQQRHPGSTSARCGAGSRPAAAGTVIGSSPLTASTDCRRIAGACVHRAAARQLALRGGKIRARDPAAAVWRLSDAGGGIRPQSGAWAGSVVHTLGDCPAGSAASQGAALYARRDGCLDGVFHFDQRAQCPAVYIRAVAGLVGVLEFSDTASGGTDVCRRVRAAPAPAAIDAQNHARRYGASLLSIAGRRRSPAMVSGV